MTGSYLGSLQDLHHRQADQLHYRTGGSDSFWSLDNDMWSEYLLGSGDPYRRLQESGAARNSARSGTEVFLH